MHRRRGRSASPASPRRATRRTRVCFVGPDGTLRTRATRPACGSSPAVTSSPTRRRPTSTSRRWHRTLDELEAREPARIALPHYGVFEDVTEHVAQLRRRLDLWAGRVESGVPVEQFVATAEAELAADGEGDTDYYSSHSPWVPSYLGLARYWAKRREAGVTPRT